MTNKGFTLIEFLMTLGIATILGGTVGRATIPHVAKDKLEVTVNEKVVKRYNNRDKYLIFTTKFNGEKEVFEDSDSLISRKFNSSDVYASLESGKKYDIQVYGWRIPILSAYRNIEKVNPIEKK